jgi:preprotein translocase subunit SecE
MTMIQFVKDSWQELKQVNWLTRAQMIASTWLVIFLVAVFAVYIFVVDKLIQAVFSRLVS